MVRGKLDTYGNVPDPTEPYQIANKRYVDSAKGSQIQVALGDNPTQQEIPVIQNPPNKTMVIIEQFFASDPELFTKVNDEIIQVETTGLYQIHINLAVLQSSEVRTTENSYYQISAHAIVDGAITELEHIVNGFGSYAETRTNNDITSGITIEVTRLLQKGTQVYVRLTWGNLTADGTAPRIFIQSGAMTFSMTFLRAVTLSDKDESEKKDIEISNDNNDGMPISEAEFNKNVIEFDKEKVKQKENKSKKSKQEKIKEDNS